MLQLVIDYLSNLNLIVNTGKTCVIYFEARASGYSPNVTVNNCVIASESSTKFLGVRIDSKLSWEPQINELCTKLRKNVFLMRQLSQTVDRVTLIQCYYAFIHSNLSYGNLVWGGAAPIHTKKVFSLQKSAVRIIENLEPTQTCKNIFKKLKILTLPSLFIFLTVAVRDRKSLKTTAECRCALSRYQEAKGLSPKSLQD